MNSEEKTESKKIKLNDIGYYVSYLLIVFKNLPGIIISVSIFWISILAAIPLCWVNAFEESPMLIGDFNEEDVVLGAWN